MSTQSAAGQKDYPGIGWVRTECPPEPAAIVEAREVVTRELGEIRAAVGRLRATARRLQRIPAEPVAELNLDAVTLERWFGNEIMDAAGCLDATLREVRFLQRPSVWRRALCFITAEIHYLLRARRERAEARALVGGIARLDAAQHDAEAQRARLRELVGVGRFEGRPLEQWRHRLDSLGLTLGELWTAGRYVILDPQTGERVTTLAA